MSRRLFLPFLVLLALPAFACGAESKIRLAIVSGGHGFDPQAFLAMFENQPDIACTHLPQKIGGELFSKVDDFPYDVVLFYNFNQKIGPQEQANFKKLVDRGVGLVVVHHAMAAYPDWPEFGRIAGAEFHLKPVEQNGVKKPGSGVKFGVTYKVHVADRGHPITAGLEDFEVTDETYNHYTVQPDLKPLLTTDEPASDKVVAGVRTEGKSRVVFTQLGHDGKVYGNPGYRHLILGGVRWAAGRSEK